MKKIYMKEELLIFMALLYPAKIKKESIQILSSYEVL